jgi:hypothetical protein
VPNLDPPRLPPGRQPYDPLNGLRVGALSGGLTGAVAAVVIGPVYAWLVLVGAVAGGAIGYWYERRSLRRARGGVGQEGEQVPGEDAPPGSAP